MSFPENFVWGAAAASYQIEGAAYEDGKGLSVWDMFCRWPGKVADGQTGDVACDHYHRYQEDMDLMAEIGLQAYRLSLSWPRILPEGVGAVNEKGLDFYDRLVDGLLARGIRPWVTLFHWDFPYALYLRGGWLNRAVADWFAEYTRVVVDRLSDRVQHWMTLNEPQVFLDLGHRVGEHAPGLKLPFHDMLVATHHALLAHGRAVQVIRSRAKTPPLVGAAPVGNAKIPASDDAADVEAARARMMGVWEKNGWNVTWFSDPMVLGKYPADGLDLFEAELPPIGADDMATIHQPLDFYGANVYHGNLTWATETGPVERFAGPDGEGLTMMDWPVRPSSLYWSPRFLYERYQLPIVVTENGVAGTDWVHVDGRVHDPYRIDFLTRHLRQFHRAMADGVEGLGYFQWSILDNFEWAFGYKKRFGLVYVDFQSQQRILKDSAHWYRDVIADNGESLLA